MAILFGVVIPKHRRARQRAVPVALVPFAGVTAPPPRPQRMRVVEQMATPAVAAIAVEEEAPRATQMANGTQGQAQSTAVQYPPLRLEIGGSVESSIAMPDHRGPALRVQPQVFDGTLQFLPGRLEMIDGRESGQEVRFVKSAGPDGTSVTFGRSDGPAYRHVQLNEPTVSRLHAKMALDGKMWHLINLSKTNPVVVNGRPMAGEGDTLALSDGDRIEMGEVVFRFHSK